MKNESPKKTKPTEIKKISKSEAKRLSILQVENAKARRFVPSPVSK